MSGAQRSKPGAGPLRAARTAPDSELPRKLALVLPQKATAAKVDATVGQGRLPSRSNGEEPPRGPSLRPPLPRRRPCGGCDGCCASTSWHWLCYSSCQVACAGGLGSCATDKGPCRGTEASLNVIVGPMPPQVVLKRVPVSLTEPSPGGGTLTDVIAPAATSPAPQPLEQRSDSPRVTAVLTEQEARREVAREALRREIADHEMANDIMEAALGELRRPTMEALRALDAAAQYSPVHCMAEQLSSRGVSFGLESVDADDDT